MDYVIIVNDNGELKTITATELDDWEVSSALEETLNYVLDARSAREERQAAMTDIVK